MKSKIDRFFGLTENKTSVKTEVLAGTTTFMAMAYILAVQPFLMNAAGMDSKAVFATTAILAGVFSIFMGLYAKIPFALAPGMGSNVVFAYTLVAGGIATWQVGLGLTLVSGVLFLGLTLFGVREVIVKLVPKSIKLAIGAAVGIFIASIGLKNSGLMVIAGGSIKMGSFNELTVVVSALTLLVAASLTVRKVRGALFITIILSTVASILLGLVKLPANFDFSIPSIKPIFFQLDLHGLLNPKLFPFFFAFFMGDFFSTLGTLLGVAGKANLLDEDGNMKDIQKPFLVDAAATTVGALMGSTVVTTYVESSAGVEEGGRTGLTAITTGFLFLLALFFAPIALMIPNTATGPILVLIGTMMFSGISKIDFSDSSEAIPALILVFFTAFAGGLGNGITFGILSFVIIKVLAGKAKDLNIGIYILCIPLILGLVMK